nr:polysaccharide pyruvyl transferase family protein [Oharaeibacter diazotrophicus]
MLTFHRRVDYGSYWQTRCLLAGLARRGHAAVVADHASDHVRRAELACALAPLGDGPAARADVPDKVARIRAFRRAVAELPLSKRVDIARPETAARADVPDKVARIRAFRRAVAELPLSKRFDIARPETMEPADLALFGGDEIWNPHHPWYGGAPLFFGGGVPARRYVAYAAGAGGHDATLGFDADRSARLGAFADVSVRDDNTRRLCRDATGREPEIVLDPCLQFPPPHEAPDAEGPPCIVVYGHGFPRWFADAVVAFARRRALPIVGVGHRSAVADEQRLAAGPEEFRRLMASAAAVVTNVFHGCVFALAFGRPFVAAASPARRDDLRDLVALVGAQHHVVDETRAATVDTVLSAPADAVVRRRIEALRARSDAFLDRVLG